MNNLEQLLNQIESKIPFFEAYNLSVSKSDIGWHLEHILLTLNGITSVIAKSDPKNYKWKFSFLRILVFTTKKIPRGKAKSPEVVQPKGNINIDTLKDHLSKTREKIKTLNSVNENNYFEHPYFGKLKTKQTIDFLEIHTKHHLKIIDDILK